jgi:putative DNA-invertase from lambdoid prophage Rac
MTQPKRVALYCRVSTKDQNCERQRHDLTQWASRMDAEIVEVFTETASGAKVDRAVRAAVIKGAKARRFDAILVTEPSRWSRSLVDLVLGIEELTRYGVSLLSQNGLSLDVTSPTGRLIVGVMGSLAEFERDLMRERVLSGIAAARRRGVKLGRRPGFVMDKPHDANIMRLRDEGVSIRAIANDLKISTATVQAAIKRNPVTVHTA